MTFNKFTKFYFYGFSTSFMLTNYYDLYRRNRKYDFLKPHLDKYNTDDQKRDNINTYLDKPEFKHDFKQVAVEAALFPFFPIILFLKHNQDSQFFKKTFVDIQLELEKDEIKREIDKLPDLKHVNFVKNKIYYHK